METGVRDMRKTNRGMAALLSAALTLGLLAALPLSTARAASPTTVGFANITLTPPAGSYTLYYQKDPLDPSRFIAGTDQNYAVSYTNDSAGGASVLTLKNVSITLPANLAGGGKAGVYAKGGGLTIKLIGVNTIGQSSSFDVLTPPNTSYGLYGDGCDLTVTGGGTADSLTLTGGKAGLTYGVYANGGMTIDGCTLSANGGVARIFQDAGGNPQAGRSYGMYVDQGKLQCLNGAVVTATAGSGGTAGSECGYSYGVFIQGGDAVLSGASRMIAAGSSAICSGYAAGFSRGLCIDSQKLTINGAATLTASSGLALRSSIGLDSGGITIGEGARVTAVGGTASEPSGVSAGIFAGLSVNVANSTVVAKAGSANTVSAIRYTGASPLSLAYQQGYRWRVAEGGDYTSGSVSAAPAAGWFAPLYVEICPDDGAVGLPQTGDAAAPGLWLGLMLLGAAGLAACTRRYCARNGITKEKELPFQRL